MGRARRPRGDRCRGGASEGLGRCGRRRRSATTPSNVQTRTYTCDGQTFEVTTGRWSGAATSTTPDLNGAAVLHLKSVYNATKKLGWVDGGLSIAAADGRARTPACQASTWTASSTGAAARPGAATASSSRLSGSFSKTGGLTGGVIGSGAGRLAAEREGHALHVRTDAAEDCMSAARSRRSAQPRSRSSRRTAPPPARTCTVKDDTSDRVKVGDQVELTCSQIAGAWVLTKVRKR